MKGLGAAFPASLPAVQDAPAADDSIDDEEEFEGFNQADIDVVKRRIDTSSEEVRQWLRIDNDCPVFQHASDEDIKNNVTRNRVVQTLSAMKLTIPIRLSSRQPSFLKQLRDLKKHCHGSRRKR